MGFLIDASVILGHQRNTLWLGHRFEKQLDAPFFVSVVTLSELFHCVHRVDRPLARTRRSDFVEAIVETFPILDLDLPTARAHADLRAELGGRMERFIGAHGLWLAAACIAHDLTFATTGSHRLAGVPDLRVEDWTQP